MIIVLLLQKQEEIMAQLSLLLSLEYRVHQMEDRQLDAGGHQLEDRWDQDDQCLVVGGMLVVQPQKFAT